MEESGDNRDIGAHGKKRKKISAQEKKAIDGLVRVNGNHCHHASCMPFVANTRQIMVGIKCLYHEASCEKIGNRNNLLSCDITY